MNPTWLALSPQWRVLVLRTDLYAPAIRCVAYRGFPKKKGDSIWRKTSEWISRMLAPLSLLKVFKQCHHNCLSIRCADSKAPASTFLPHVYFLWLPPVRIQHLSPSTFKYFNLRESQYPRWEQAERSAWSQVETEYLLSYLGCNYLVANP